ncbi:P-loop protein of unknown function [Deinococcus reticulitermitis]|uniref:ATP-binding protein n=1 Tax=Deinococcus reticulitermitis TaxID=856736 RepID=A0A1H6WZ21_9DEIO|nr:BREX system ATP-binding domain-containing protein [Deinococcus reticulitermitis]SEJ17605.1 P-loop protein of unknown function [Deinococcus reticulitermitis]
MPLSQQDADIIISALRTGTVPDRGLHHYAVGLEKEFEVLREDLHAVKGGRSRIKGIRGAYGSGKTFVVSRLAEDAWDANFVVSKVTLNRDGSSLAALERLYQGIMQNLRMRGTDGGALPALLDRWIERAEEYAVEVRGIDEDDENALREAVTVRMNELLGEVAREKPAFAAALSAYARAHITGDYELKRTVVGWLMADPNTSARTIPGVKGKVERTEVLTYLRVLVGIIRSLDRSGLVVILDELDEMRKLPSDGRAKAWANLRDLADQVGNGFPGLYLVLAGTPEVYSGMRGFKDLPPLAQRFEDSTLDTSHPNLRGPQLPLPRFGEAQLEQVMARLRDIWEVATGLSSRLDPNFGPYLARGWARKLGDMAPRIAIREYVSVLDRVRDYPDFDPYSSYQFTVPAADLRDEEKDVSVAEEDVF